ncbi:hypothetical protein ZOSMA_1780G00020, partial [Zostera marina]
MQINTTSDSFSLSLCCKKAKIQGLYEVTFRALLDQKWKYHITFKK